MPTPSDRRWAAPSAIAGPRVPSRREAMARAAQARCEVERWQSIVRSRMSA
ncbi:hypothetical protein OG249_35000 [Streptomyces microflavus]|uniref:hypothetical protein n=1 Tax=Streptomyces microflavus TaxID=1919 RepID=UPI0022582409|nr:hypothetical protein [Streptomyces microflavus]MCX4657088.1 hypothetical protein [Streptomyces microflavus]